MLGTGGRTATFTQIFAFIVYLGLRGLQIDKRRIIYFSLAVCGLIYAAQIVNDFRDKGFEGLDSNSESNISAVQLMQTFFGSKVLLYRLLDVQ